MPDNNGGNDFFSGFDRANNANRRTANGNEDFFAGFDTNHEKKDSAKPQRQQTMLALPTSSNDSTPQKSETDKRTSSHIIVPACIILLCVGSFAYKLMNDSNAPPPVNIPVQEKKEEKVTLQAVSYKQFKNDRTGIVFEYPETCSFDTVGSEECRFKIDGVAEISVGKNTDPAVWDVDIKYNMRRIEGDRTIAGETISNMQIISDNSCLWTGKTKLGCLYITKSYFITSTSDGKTSRYDMMVYFPQVGYSLDSDPKTKEMVQYMLGSYRVDPPAKQTNTGSEPSRNSSTPSTTENAKPQTEYKTFRNDAVGYSFDYPPNVSIEKTSDTGLKFSLTPVVKFNVHRNNTNVWSYDMERNIAAIKDDARIYRDSIEKIQTLSDNSLIIYGKDKHGMNYIEKAYFITNPADGNVARYDMTIYCDSQGYKLDSEPTVNTVVQAILDSYKFQQTKTPL